MAGGSTPSNGNGKAVAGAPSQSSPPPSDRKRVGFFRKASTKPNSAIDEGNSDSGGSTPTKETKAPRSSMKSSMKATADKADALQSPPDNASPQRRRMGGRRGSETAQFSPYAVGLGFQSTEKWADFGSVDHFPSAGTDRTHGAIGRTLNNGEARQAAARKGAGAGASGSSQAAASGKRGLYGHYTPVPNLELVQPPGQPAETRDLPDFTGHWKCVKVEGSWETYLQLCEVEERYIKLAIGARFGAGLAMQDIVMPFTKEQITVMNSTFTVGWDSGVRQTQQPKHTFVIDGTQQQAAVGAAMGAGGRGASGTISVQWENKSLVTRYTIGSQKLPCLMKRYLTDGQMHVKIMCADFYASRVFVQVDAEGDWVVSTPLRIIRPTWNQSKASNATPSTQPPADGEQRKSRVFDQVEISGPTRPQRGRSRSEVFDEDELAAKLEGSPLMSGKADDSPDKAKPRTRKFSLLGKK